MNKKWGTPDDEGDLSEFEARDLMCEIGRRMWVMNMADANSGNISYRLSNDRILATPTWIAKGCMDPDDLVVLDMNGNHVSGKRKKTSEILLHLAVYRNRPDIKGVVHAHPRNAVAFAITKTPLPQCVLPEIELVVGEVPTTEYNTPGSQDFANSLQPFIKDYTAFLLAQHGVLTVGRGLIEAYWRMEIIEGFCAMVIAANSLGRIQQVTEGEMAQIMKIKQAWGQPDRRFSDPQNLSCASFEPKGSSCSSGGTTKSGESELKSASSFSASPDPALVESIVRRVLERINDRS